MVCHQYFKFVYCTVHLLVFWGSEKCPNGHQYKWRAWMPSSQLIFPRIWKISDRCKTFEKTERLSGPRRPLLKFNLREEFPAINHMVCSFSGSPPVNSAAKYKCHPNIHFCHWAEHSYICIFAGWVINEIICNCWGNGRQSKWCNLIFWTKCNFGASCIFPPPAKRFIISPQIETFCRTDHCQCLIRPAWNWKRFTRWFKI